MQWEGTNRSFFFTWLVLLLQLGSSGLFLTKPLLLNFAGYVGPGAS